MRCQEYAQDKQPWLRANRRKHIGKAGDRFRRRAALHVSIILVIRRLSSFLFAPFSRNAFPRQGILPLWLFSPRKSERGFLLTPAHLYRIISHFGGLMQIRKIVLALPALLFFPAAVLPPEPSPGPAPAAPPTR